METSLRDAIRMALRAHTDVAVDFALEHPADHTHGDYATNAALVAAKVVGANPRALAETLATTLRDMQIAQVDEVTVAGPGFINFTLNRSFFADVVSQVLEEGEQWRRSSIYAGKRVLVEYTQPNPFKAFHIGHLMGNAIGESLSRLVEYGGAEVARANYQGDVGPHVAKALYGLLKQGISADEPLTPEILGAAYVSGTEAYESDPEAKAAIDTINKEVYEGTFAHMDLYEKGRAASLEHFETLYAVLGTRFDHYFFESAVWRDGEQRVREGLAKGIFAESDGAVVYRGEDEGLHTRVFITSKGIPTYETKEIGLAFAKQETWPFDLNITVTAVEQDSYFRVVQAALSKLDATLAEKYQHVHHGMMQLASGKMSSRRGNVVTGESIITTMRERAYAKIADRPLGDAERKEVADAVAVAAIKYSILKQSMGKNIAFDPEQALSFEGDSGPYLQYTYARTCSIAKKAIAEGVEADATKPTPTVSTVEKLLARFPEVVERALVEREPHYVTTYLAELASAFNAFYAQEKIVDVHDQYSPYKLALSQAVGETLKKGLWLMGIRTPERM